MAEERMQLELRVAWWLVPYLHALAFVAARMQREPDWQKLERVLNRAIRLREPGGRWR